jgi:large subunit ribosomal protein L29
METTKIRNLSDDEIRSEELKASEQIFRLRFNLKLGQTDGVKKLRELKQDIAKMKTIARERALGIRGAQAQSESTGALTAKTPKTKKKGGR